MIIKIEFDTQTKSGRKIQTYIEKTTDKNGITYLNKEGTIKLIELNTNTRSGFKVHVYIERLNDRTGIRYPDFNEDDYMTEEEFEEFTNQFIKKLEEKYGN